jgi:hypothetical protein
VGDINMDTADHWTLRQTANSTGAGAANITGVQLTSSTIQLAKSAEKIKFGGLTNSSVSFGDTIIDLENEGSFDNSTVSARDIAAVRLNGVNTSSGAPSLTAHTIESYHRYDSSGKQLNPPDTNKLVGKPAGPYDVDRTFKVNIV